jgi:hypothetical protein
MISMNYLVYLNAQAGELEKILSGLKSMLVKEFDPAQPTVQPVKPGDSLYFLRDKEDCALRVKATVTRILFFTRKMDGDLSQVLKELQPRLQLTEAQYSHWSAREQLQLVEFEAAQKIGAIRLAAPEDKGQSNWLAFEAFSLVTE